jgi:flagellar motor switch protein FliG
MAEAAQKFLDEQKVKDIIAQKDTLDEKGLNEILAEMENELSNGEGFDKKQRDFIIQILERVYDQGIEKGVEEGEYYGNL